MNRKTIKLLAIALATMGISACNKPSEPQKLITDSISTQDSVETQKIDSFLITNTKAGLFDVNDTIGGLIKAYGYEERQGKDTETGVSNETSILSSKDNQDELVIFHKRAIPKHGEDSYNDDKRYICVNNCGEYYFYRDSINRIEIHSDRYKTREGIGIGSTFKELQEAYTGLQSEIRIDCEEGGGAEAIVASVKTKEYPNVWFQFDEQNENYEKPEDEVKQLGPEDGSHFKQDSKILYIIIER